MSLYLKYVDTPDGAQEAMTVSGTGGQDFSEIDMVAHGAADVPWATAEPGGWLLDGRYKILPDDPHPGFWSMERTDDNGKFSVPPNITISLPLPYTATGFTFTFSPATEQWCSAIHVAWYNGQTKLAEGDYFPDSAQWVLERAVDAFDRIWIELLATNKPGQFAKIQKIEIGRTIQFGPGELISVHVINEIDPLLCELTADTMTVKTITRGNLLLVPQSNQKMELYRNGMIQAVQYIKSSVRESNDGYSFTCQSVIGLLDETYLGGLFDNYPLASILSDVLGQWRFEMSPALSGAVVSGYLPVCTQREALQQIAFAVGAVITTGDGIIHLSPVPETVSGSFFPDDIFFGAKVDTEPRIARLELSAHSYSASQERETLLQDETINGTSVLVTFDAPHHDYIITGGEIVDSGANWCRITANGDVTLTACKYIHASVAYVRRDPMATAKEQGNSLAVSDATLIHKGNVKTVLDRLKKTCDLRKTLNAEAVISSQKAGDYAAIASPWGSTINGYISSMDSTYTQGGHTAAISVIGAEVALSGVAYHSGEIYSGDKEVLY